MGIRIRIPDGHQLGGRTRACQFSLLLDFLSLRIISGLGLQFNVQFSSPRHVILMLLFSCVLLRRAVLIYLSNSWGTEQVSKKSRSFRFVPNQNSAFGSRDVLLTLSHNGTNKKIPKILKSNNSRFFLLKKSSVQYFSVQFIRNTNRSRDWQRRKKTRKAIWDSWWRYVLVYRYRHRGGSAINCQKSLQSYRSLILIAQRWATVTSKSNLLEEIGKWR